MKSIKRVSSIVAILLVIGCSSQKSELQTQSISNISNSTKSELEDRKAMEYRIKGCDKNGDNQVSLDELPKGDPMMPIEGQSRDMRCIFINIYTFEKKDKNRDNILTIEELLVKEPEVKIVDPRGEEVYVDKKTKMRNRYRECDKNRDKKLTLSEANTKKCGIPKDKFIEIDSNHDNFLTLQEIIDMFEKKRKEEASQEVVTY